MKTVWVRLYTNTVQWEYRRSLVWIRQHQDTWQRQVILLLVVPFLLLLACLTHSSTRQCILSHSQRLTWNNGAAPCCRSCDLSPHKQLLDGLTCVVLWGVEGQNLATKGMQTSLTLTANNGLKINLCETPISPQSLSLIPQSWTACGLLNHSPTALHSLAIVVA